MGVAEEKGNKEIWGKIVLFFPEQIPSRYEYIHTYVYCVYTYIHVCVCVYIYIYIDVCAHIYISIYI